MFAEIKYIAVKHRHPAWWVVFPEFLVILLILVLVPAQYI